MPPIADTAQRLAEAAGTLPRPARPWWNRRSVARPGRGNGGPPMLEEALAVRIARGLAFRHGGRASERATELRRNAWAAGDIGRTDLLSAVCTIVADADGVFSRSCLPPPSAKPPR